MGKQAVFLAIIKNVWGKNRENNGNRSIFLDKMQIIAT